MPDESSGRLSLQQAPIAGFLPIRILDWQPRRGRRLVGQVTVLAGDLKLHDCPVLVQGGRLHVSLPARPVYGPDGQHLTTPTGGLHYETIVAWRNKAVADEFSAAVVAALLAKHPEVSA